MAQDPPPVPQSADDCCVWHCPSVPQHPVAQVDRPQATAPELLPDPELPLDELWPPELLPDPELPLDEPWPPELLPDPELPLDEPCPPELLPDPELPLDEL
jgi:hypothetical protein